MFTIHETTFALMKKSAWWILILAGCAASHLGEGDAAVAADVGRCAGDLREERGFCVGWRTQPGPRPCYVWGGWNLRIVADQDEIADQCPGEPTQVYDSERGTWRDVADVTTIAAPVATTRPPVPMGFEIAAEALLPDGTLVDVVTEPLEARCQTWIATSDAAWERSLDPPTCAITGNAVSFRNEEALFLGNAEPPTFELAMYFYVRRPL